MTTQTVRSHWDDSNGTLEPLPSLEAGMYLNFSDEKSDCEIALNDSSFP